MEGHVKGQSKVTYRRVKVKDQSHRRNRMRYMLKVSNIYDAETFFVCGKQIKIIHSQGTNLYKWHTLIYY